MFRIVLMPQEGYPFPSYSSLLITCLPTCKVSVKHYHEIFTLLARASPLYCLKAEYCGELVISDKNSDVILTIALGGRDSGFNRP